MSNSIKLSTEILSKLDQSCPMLNGGNMTLSLVRSQNQDKTLITNLNIQRNSESLSIPTAALLEKAQVSIEIDSEKFFKALKFFKVSPTLVIESNYIELKKGNKKIKIEGKAPSAGIVYTFQDLGKLSLNSIKAIERGINMMSSLNFIAILRDNYLMVVNSGSRESMYLTELEDTLPKTVTIGKNTENVVLSLSGKKLSTLLKAFVAQSTWLKVYEYKLSLAIANNNICGVRLYAENEGAYIETILPLLDADTTKRENNVLNKCSTFKPELEVEVDALTLYEASYLALISKASEAEDPKLILSNKGDLTKLEVKNTSDSFSDELVVSGNCKFHVVVRNLNLSNMLKLMGPVKVKLAFDKGPTPMNILTIKDGRERCFISCFSDSTQNMPFFVEEIKDEKNSVVSTGMDNTSGRTVELGIQNTTEGSVQKPAGSTLIGT